MTNWLIWLAIIIGSAIGGYFYGVNITQNAADAEAGRQAAKEKVIYKQKEARLNKLSTELENTKREREKLSRQLAKEVAAIKERPIYQSACFDADGLRILNDAIERRSPNTGQFPSPMPRP